MRRTLRRVTGREAPQLTRGPGGKERLSFPAEFGEEPRQQANCWDFVDGFWRDAKAVLARFDSNFE